MRLDPIGILGLKLWSEGTVQKPQVVCEVFSRHQVTPNKRLHVLDTLIWMLNIDEQINDFYALAKRDKLLKGLMNDRYGMRSTNRPDIFPRVILAITLQMAPVKRSQQMMDLLAKEYGETIEFDGKKVVYWPSPQKIGRVSVEELQKKCRLGYRAKILRGIARTLVKGFPQMHELYEMPTEEARGKIMELHGVGDYSEYIILQNVGFPIDSWSAKIFSLLLCGKQPESPREAIQRLKRLAEERWGKWRWYVFLYVLNDLENLSRRYRLDLEES